MQDQEVTETDGPVCPSCERTLPEASRICAPCGIYVPSGRPLITAQKVEDEEEYYAKKTKLVQATSYVMPFGILALTSQTGGSRKPMALWIIMGVTIFCSVVFFILGIIGGKNMWAAKDLMLWAGNKPPTPVEISSTYRSTRWGNSKRYQKKYDAAMAVVEDAEAEKEEAEEARSKAAGETPEQRFRRQMKEYRVAAKAERAKQKKAEDAEDDEDEDDPKVKAKQKEEHAKQLEKMMSTLGTPEMDKAAVDANNALPPGERAFGEFHFYQLFTHILLHGGFTHIFGNLMFLFVFGKSINLRIGDVGTYIVYITVGVLAGTISFLFTNYGHPPVPMIGASGAIMGMAGFYMALFPIYPTHNVIWLRLFWFFRCRYYFFVCRGFWIILFYVVQDVIAIYFGAHDGVGHWAHFGGFLSGFAIASILIFTRGINSQGADIYSVILGKYAWPLVGKPSQWQMGIKEGWLQRLHPMDLVKKQVVRQREANRLAKEEAAKEEALEAAGQ